MSTPRELIGPAVRIALRELATSIPLRSIHNLWQSEGFAPKVSFDDEFAPKPGERRQAFQTYLDAVDWTDERHVTRAVRVFERLLDDYYAGSNQITYHRALQELEREGYRMDSKGRLTKAGIGLSPGALANLTDATAIHEGLDRIRRAEQHEDAALVIGGAKELIESTAKLVLRELGETIDPRADIQDLIRRAQQGLHLSPAKKASGPDGTEAVKKILGSASAIAVGVAELRNRGYGTGHGPAGPRSGLSSRHAHLAANAAVTWCELILETLADPRAPWRGTPSS
ncbi:abortive infection family protein [Streptosporangium canum]|uniref:abortive infection family protein n=1 Tax=Streptosporangium canum TaxID=324952 RepID=UPI00378D385D